MVNLVADSRGCDVDVYGRLLPLVGTVNLVADSRVCGVDVYGRPLPLVGTVNLVAGCVVWMFTVGYSPWLAR